MQCGAESPQEEKSRKSDDLRLSVCVRPTPIGTRVSAISPSIRILSISSAAAAAANSLPK
jgi:hypothetical protein